MVSVKGLTRGSPEFVRIAKAAEQEGEANWRLKQAVDHACSFAYSEELENVSTETLRRCRNALADAFGLYTEEWCE